ncbi:MAG TPA: prepilin-type N-terminal cleavage/methylation domain-containing protein, partial [Patescibacteria group bacterium]|nr:prepilin-type N-terminal cleavage/methylation domain-containing protein [Patescibacteria group bacterium]
MKIRVKIDLFRSKIGFTLVEVLVVLSLIGLVATIAVVNLPIIQKRARDAQRLTDLRQLQLVLEKEIILSDVYPLSTGSFEIKDHSWGSLWAEHNYRLPKDPLSSQKYIYVSDGQTYQLYANFE